MSKVARVGNYKMNLIEVQKALAAEGKNHLTPLMMQAYATNKESLTVEELENVESHINDDHCDRCKKQIIMAQRILTL